MFDFNDKLPNANKLLQAAKAAYDTPEAQHLRAFDTFSRRQCDGRWRSSMAQVITDEVETLEPENALREAVRTYITHLIGEEIAPEITPLAMGDHGQAILREYRMKRLLADMDYSSEREAAIIDAMHTIGILYFGIKAGQTLMRIGDSTIDPGQAFEARIPLSAFVYDPNVTLWRRKSYMGHAYSACVDAMLEAGIGNEKVISQIPRLWETDKYGGKAILPATLQSAKQEQFIEDEIALWDFTFKHRGRRYRCVLPPFDGVNEFVVAPFEDMEPEIGPYNILELNPSNGDGVCVSPAMALMDAHLVGKAMASRLAWEGLNTRRKVVAEQGDQAFAMKLLDANDPEGVIFANGQTVKEVTIGGMVKELLEAYGVMKTMRQTIGPNVELAGGQDDPSDSATGTSILAGNAGMAFGDMRKRIARWDGGNLERVSWSLDSEEGFEQQYDVPLPNGETVPIVWSGDTRDTSYNQFRYSTKPSTESSMDPRAQLRSLIEIMGVLPQFLQSVQLMGGDMRAAIDAVAHTAQNPHLSRILPTQSAQLIQQQLATGLAMQAQKMQMGGGSPGGYAPQRSGAAGQMDQRQSDYALTRAG